MEVGCGLGSATEQATSPFGVTRGGVRSFFPAYKEGPCVILFVPMVVLAGGVLGCCVGLGCCGLVRSLLAIDQSRLQASKFNRIFFSLSL